MPCQVNDGLDLGYLDALMYQSVLDIFLDLITLQRDTLNPVSNEVNIGSHITIDIDTLKSSLICPYDNVYLIKKKTRNYNNNLLKKNKCTLCGENNHNKRTCPKPCTAYILDQILNTSKYFQTLQ